MELFSSDTASDNAGKRAADVFRCPRATFLKVRASWPVAQSAMDALQIAPLEEHQITAAAKVINAAYAYESFKIDNTRIYEADLRTLVASGTSRHFVASVPPNHPWVTEHSVSVFDCIVGHVLYVAETFHFEPRPCADLTRHCCP